MVLDSSALVAILLGEPEAGAFEEAIQQSIRCLMSAASVLECTIVLRKRLGASGVARLDRFIEEWPVSIRGIDLEQLRWARHAVETYGRGRHPAKLNFGDCFSYALAKKQQRADPVQRHRLHSDRSRNRIISYSRFVCIRG